VVGPDWGAEGEDGEDNGVVDFAPVVEIEALHRVSKELEGLYGGLAMGRHRLGVGVPAEVVLEEDPQIPD